MSKAKQWDTDIISIDPSTIVSLARVSAVVNEFFHLDPDDAVNYDTPFVWWDRSKRNNGIALPMPEPVTYLGAGRTSFTSVGRAPLWYQEQIIQWFGAWRELDVPECAQAGDRISSRGYVIPSPYRVS